MELTCKKTKENGRTVTKRKRKQEKKQKKKLEIREKNVLILKSNNTHRIHQVRAVYDYPCNVGDNERSSFYTKKKEKMKIQTRLLRKQTKTCKKMRKHGTSDVFSEEGGRNGWRAELLNVKPASSTREKPILGWLSTRPGRSNGPSWEPDVSIANEW